MDCIVPAHWNNTLFVIPIGHINPDFESISSCCSFFSFLCSVLGMIVGLFVYYCLEDDCLSFCLLLSWGWLFVFLSIIVLGMIVCLFVYYCLEDDCLSFCLLLSWRWLFVFLSIIVLVMIVCLFVYYCLGDDCLSFCLLLSWRWLFVFLSIIVLVMIVCLFVYYCWTRETLEDTWIPALWTLFNKCYLYLCIASLPLTMANLAF